jgi:hypothetical protein
MTDLAIEAPAPPAVLAPAIFDSLRSAALPMDGNIGDHVAGVVAAFARILPPAEWPRLTYADLTAGSCFLPLLFGAAGVERLVVNDNAARTALAARALFGGVVIDIGRLPALIEAPASRLQAHVPTFHILCDYFTAEVAEVFDRFYFADLPPEEAPVYRYLALRWAQSFAADGESDFEPLPTQAHDQLFGLGGAHWARYVDQAQRPLPVLAALAASINGAIALQRARRVDLAEDDLADLAGRLNLALPALVAVNPPTRGIDEYVVDDQILHSLLANRMVPLTMSRETAEGFWTRRVRAALAALPAGAFFFVWGGDGAMRFRDCFAVWSDYGEALHFERLNRRTNAAGWAIFRRR